MGKGGEGAGQFYTTYPNIVFVGILLGWTLKIPNTLGWIPTVAIPNPDQPPLEIFLTQSLFQYQNEIVWIIFKICNTTKITTDKRVLGFCWDDYLKISNLKLGKSESVEQITANVSNIHHNTFDMGGVRKWPLVEGPPISVGRLVLMLTTLGEQLLFLMQHDIISPTGVCHKCLQVITGEWIAKGNWRYWKCLDCKVVTSCRFGTVLYKSKLKIKNWVLLALGCSKNTLFPTKK